jgi:hypothetical protein
MNVPSEPARSGEPSPWEAVAREKLARVLGPTQGVQMFNNVMAEVGLSHLATADDLVRFADHLGRREGFVRALAAVLRTHALLRGAR